MVLFPQEIIEGISRCLDRDDLRKTLTVSRGFGYAAEKYSGAFTTYDLRMSNAEKFYQLYSGHRFRFLRRVTFETPYSPLRYKQKAKPPCRETAKELRQNDEEFTEKIRFLFRTLKTLEDAAVSSHGTGRIHLVIYTPFRQIDQRICLHRFFCHWRVHLLQPELLPEIASIRSLDLQQGACPEFNCGPEEAVYALDLRAVVDLASRLPNLEAFGCALGDHEFKPRFERGSAANHCQKVWAGPRRDSRHDFAKALMDHAEHGALPPLLRDASLDFVGDINMTATNIDHVEVMPDLTHPALFDPFGSSLRILSQHLRTMRLRVVADETLFWPVESQHEETPSWPHLEILDVMFHPVMPSGAWYFRAPHGKSHRASSSGAPVTDADYPPMGPVPHREDVYWEVELQEFLGARWENLQMSQIRYVPDNCTLVPFLTAFAKAAANMPALRGASLWAPIEVDTTNIDPADFEDWPASAMKVCLSRMAWGFVYTGPGQIGIAHRTPRVTRQLFWAMGGWRPPPELHALFRYIGRVENGEDLVEYWDDANKMLWGYRQKMGFIENSFFRDLWDQESFGVPRIRI